MRSVAPIVMLAGGHVAFVHWRTAGREGTLALDTRDGHEIVRVEDMAPRLLEDGSAAALVDSQAKDQQHALLVKADRTLTRGALGEIMIGKRKVRTYAGVAEPTTACDVLVPTRLPPLVEYPGPIYLPADLVR